MAIYKKLVNFNKVFRQLKKPPIIVNDLQTTTEEERNDLNNKIYTLYDSGVLNTVATCDCGAITGNYNVGMTCSSCGTEVVSPLYQNLEPILWVRAPKGIKALINPDVWFHLNKTFKISNVSLIRYLTDPSYQCNTSYKEIKALEETQLPRSYNYFIEHFDEIIAILSKLCAKDEKRIEQIGLLNRTIQEYRDCIFCDYIPLPNRTLLVIEDTNMGRYADDVYYGVIDAIQMIASIDTIRTKKKGQDVDNSMSVSELFDQAPSGENEFVELKNGKASADLLIDNTSLKRKEIRTVKMLESLTQFYNNYYRSNLGKKPGLFRKHVLSTRANFSCRAVISSNTDRHRYDELTIPWTTAVGMFRYHLLNKLVRRGFGANEAIQFLNTYASRYNSLMDQLFTELIQESTTINKETGETETGIPVTLCRNPSFH